MAAEIMQLPYPEHNAFPTGCPCVLHNRGTGVPSCPEASISPGTGEMLVSLYFHRVRELAANNPVPPAIWQTVRKTLRKRLGPR